MRVRKGFTLVELMVTISIIAVLAALILPFFMTVEKKPQPVLAAAPPVPVQAFQAEVAKPISRTLAADGLIALEVVMCGRCKWVLIYRTRDPNGPMEAHHAFDCDCFRERLHEPVVEAPQLGQQ